MDVSNEFPALKRKIFGKKLVYLDSACSALKMKSAALAQMEYLLNYGCCAGKRSTHILSESAEEKFQYARQKIASFIGALPEEIIFVSGTTEAMNIVSNSLSLEKNDEVIISGLEHNSVFLPFYRLSKEKGVKLNIIPLKNFQPDFAVFRKMIGKRTKLLCLTAASNIFGGVEYEKFVNEAKNRKIPVLMDCAQYAPTHKIDINLMNADIIAFSGHKLGAAFGTGVLWVRKEIMPYLKSSKLGGGTIKEITKAGRSIYVRFLENYMSFEAGIQNYSGAWAIYKAMEFLESIGKDKIRKYISGLVDYAVEELTKIKEIELKGNFKNSSLISFVPLSNKFSVSDFSIYLSNDFPEYSIAFRTGKLCADLPCLYSGISSVVRLSFFIYNTQEDIDIFVKALKKYLRFLR